MIRDPKPHRGRRAVGSVGQAMAEFALVAPLFFLLFIGTFEGARFIFFHEWLSRAAQEGARYAIVHGADSTCPSGPMPQGRTNPCDPSGARVKAAVRDAALGIGDVGDLFVFEPTWTARGSVSPPRPGDASTGDNGRGEYVTVFVDFTFDPIFRQIMDIAILPTITIRAESTLVVNN